MFPNPRLCKALLDRIPPSECEEHRADDYARRHHGGGVQIRILEMIEAERQEQIKVVDGGSRSFSSWTVFLRARSPAILGNAQI